mmetsp:Transcript_23223/g.44342  ORF Transcript_23223/g.44342 Transcript_23223/m.44342 type:complete len:133 (-) Transcript_23223:381-779(-)
MLRSEDITVPTRFLMTIAHLVVTLTIIYDIDSVADSANGSKTTMEALAGASLACFAVEVVGIFAGVSLFLPTLSAFYVLLHFLGTVLTILFLALRWQAAWFSIQFILFSATPALLEMVVAFGVFKLKLMEYS